MITSSRIGRGMKFRLSSLLLSTACIALAIALLWERHVHSVRLEHELTYHATGNVNIQSAWEHGELAKEYFANPSTFGQTLERELILDVYQLWRNQQFVDVAFERRSPGNSSITLAQHSISSLNWSNASEFIRKATSLGFIGHIDSTFPELSDTESKDYASFLSFVEAVYTTTAIE